MTNCGSEQRQPTAVVVLEREGCDGDHFMSSMDMYICEDRKES
jgi:hypothetical protein